MRNLMCVATMLSLLCLGRAAAQDQPDLKKLGDRVNRHLEIKMHGWKHKHGEPMLGSKDVIEDFWSGSNRVVKISILPQKSSDEAREIVRQFVKYDSEREEIKGLGDEAYAWGYALTNIVFSKGKFTFYVSTVANVDDDADARSLTQRDRGERERSEMRRLSREFARQIVSAIDDK